MKAYENGKLTYEGDNALFVAVRQMSEATSRFREINHFSVDQCLKQGKSALADVIEVVEMLRWDIPERKVSKVDAECKFYTNKCIKYINSVNEFINSKEHQQWIADTPARLAAEKREKDALDSYEYKAYEDWS